MKVGIVITARLGSSRLPRKHLRPIAGRPGMHYLAERIRRNFQAELDDGRVELIIATSTAAENRAFRDVAPFARVFFGDSHHIPRRHLQAAWTYGLDAIVSVDGDDILCSPSAMRAVYEGLLRGEGRVSTSGLPLGMNAWGYATDVLARALEGNTERQCDTGWGRVFGEDADEVVVPMGIEEESAPGALAEASLEEPELRLTLDYEEDLAFFRAVIERLGPAAYTATDADIIRLIRAERLSSINASVIDEYWESFHAEKEEQVAASAAS